MPSNKVKLLFFKRQENVAESMRDIPQSPPMQVMSLLSRQDDLLQAEHQLHKVHILPQTPPRVVLSSKLKSDWLLYFYSGAKDQTEIMNRPVYLIRTPYSLGIFMRVLKVRCSFENHLVLLRNYTTWGHGIHDLKGAG